MKKTETVTVMILGKEYQVSCPADEQGELLQAARQLDERMRTIRQSGSVIGLERIAVMAALNLSHDLLLAKQASAANERVVNRVANKLDATLALSRKANNSNG
ncbi:cell division protein ZapA [Halioxenophilus aromaticivorans]|uniref:Cell division protein ZapA n=1 Tax=Halioxenophilus aromaticivorans TaxID=1306992 RepID=A0AAV3U5J8_9ALTE